VTHTILRSVLGQLKQHITFWLIFGPPVCGKSTLGSIVHGYLAARGTALLDMSDIIRSHLSAPTDLTPHFLEAKRLCDEGKLVPDGPIIKALGRAVIESYEKRKFTRCIVIGFPRTEPQLRELLSTGIRFKFFSVQLELDEALRRLHQRSVNEGRVRPDDAKIADRYAMFKNSSLLVHSHVRRHYGELTKIIDGTAPLRKKVVDVIRNLDLNGEYAAVMKELNDPQHPVTKRIDEIDGVRRTFTPPKSRTTLVRAGA